jgi:hypothetical protein
MALKKPRMMGGGDGVDALQYELLQETAATLARLGRKLHAALDALAAFDAAPPAGSCADGRDALVGAAGEALWYYVVQREVMRIPANDAVLRELGVPREVRLRMGINRRPSTK